jgi:hypothetical protein
MEISVQGKRRLVVNGENLFPVETPPVDQVAIFEMPAHFNLNLSAEYRYSKILTFWTKLNNISYKRYTEWVYYPTEGFMFMVGFTYSL